MRSTFWCRLTRLRDSSGSSQASTHRTLSRPQWLTRSWTRRQTSQWASRAPDTLSGTDLLRLALRKIQYTLQSRSHSMMRSCPGISGILKKSSRSPPPGGSEEHPKRPLQISSWLQDLSGSLPILESTLTFWRSSLPSAHSSTSSMTWTLLRSTTLRRSSTDRHTSKTILSCPCSAWVYGADVKNAETISMFFHLKRECLV
mmetsp:Transcript_24559/g.48192  ORF Transcript_24559/g.48192 Transcript_24559/m.48192 type:complete len:201 (-) Transcript_24559:56-658(-)